MAISTPPRAPSQRSPVTTVLLSVYSSPSAARQQRARNRPLALRAGAARLFHSTAPVIVDFFWLVGGFRPSSAQGRNQGWHKGIYTPKLQKNDLIVDEEYVANSADVNMWV